MGSGKKVVFSFLMLPRSSSQAGQMTCHSVTSLELVQLPTVATLLMAKALRATLQRTTGSSSGMCVSMTEQRRWVHKQEKILSCHLHI